MRWLILQIARRDAANPRVLHAANDIQQARLVPKCDQFMRDLYLFRRSSRMRPRAIALFQRNQRVVNIQASIAACGVYTHQRELTQRLSLVGHEFNHELRQANRLGAKFATNQGIACGCRVAAVEYQKAVGGGTLWQMEGCDPKSRFRSDNPAMLPEWMLKMED